MSFHHISIWRRSPNKLRQNDAWLECFCVFGLTLAVLMLFLVNLTYLPLLDPQEGTLALLAKEIYQPTTSNNIFSAVREDLNFWQSPLTYNLVAFAYRIAGVNELTTRLPGALLGGSSVLLLYYVGREIFVARLPALFSAIVYLTCLPVVRYSRLASLNGPLLCFELLTIWAILRSRRNLQWALVVGIGFSLMSLTKGLFALQILAIILLFILWDTPRLLTSAYFWGGAIIGSIPSFCWYLVIFAHSRNWSHNLNIIDLLIGSSAFADAEPILLTNSYLDLIRFTPYFLPWLFVMLAGTQSIQHNFQWGWGKLLSVWLAGYLTLGLIMLPQDYWLILPLFPPLALAAGKQLSQIREQPDDERYPQIWIYSFVLMSVLAALAGINWGVRNYIDFYLPFICGFLSITFAVTAIIIAQQDRQFIPLLFWGLFVSIFWLVISPHWIWELQGTEPVKPIAEMIKLHTKPEAIVYSAMSRERPSLEFYSDRQIVNQPIDKLEQHWQQDPDVCLLIDLATFKQLKLPQQAVIKDRRFNSLGWVLAIKHHS